MYHSGSPFVNDRYIDIFYAIDSINNNDPACLRMDIEIFRYFSVKLLYISNTTHQYTEELVYRVINPAGMINTQWQTELKADSNRPTKFYMVMHMKSMNPGMMATIRRVEVVPQTCDNFG